ncbi:hypothetical protein DWB58_01455 [candidate division KSB1 bacterium]|nr:hypothetical protein [candidate division KSB1 bacterium]
MSTDAFDLVILGGGVAGWAAAAFAGARGRRTCVVSRPAAATAWCDWLPPQADPLLTSLKIDPQRVSSETFDRVNLRSADLKQQTVCDSLSPCRVVRRDALRDALRQAARATGRVQHREATIVDVAAAEESVTLRADNGEQHAGRVLIAADGCDSIVVRKLLRGAVPSTLATYGAVQWSAQGTKKAKGKPLVELTVLLATHGPQGFGYVLETSTGPIAGLVEAADIEKIARLYAESEPAVMRAGWGLERNRNGGQAAAAILALPALLGKFGKRGGGYTLSNSGAYRFDGSKMAEADSWNTRTINMNVLGKVLLEEKNPPVKMLFVYNCNPVATVPNQNAIIAGLQREDLFTVVFDQVMTDTAVFADVLLPAVTFLEQHEIKKAYGSYSLHYSAPVIPALGEAKPNEEVFAMLGRAMGWEDEAFQKNTHDYLHNATHAIRGMGREISFEQLQRDKIAFFDFPGQLPIQFVTAFPFTHDGKVHFAPAQLGEHPYEFLDEETNPAYPLAMISPATDKAINSMMAEYMMPELYLEMHPADAAARGLHNNETVRVFNNLGEVVCRLKIQADVRSGVVVMPKGAWRKASKNGKTSTALSPDTLNVVGGGACFNDARVEVARFEKA